MTTKLNINIKCILIILILILICCTSRTDCFLLSRPKYRCCGIDNKESQTYIKSEWAWLPCKPDDNKRKPSSLYSQSCQAIFQLQCKTRGLSISRRIHCFQRNSSMSVLLLAINGYQISQWNLINEGILPIVTLICFDLQQLLAAHRIEWHRLANRHRKGNSNNYYLFCALY